MKPFRPFMLCTVVVAIGLAAYFVTASIGHSREFKANAQEITNHPHQSSLELSGGLADLGILSNATVSFGSWMTTPPLDRFPNASPGGPNHHELKPRIAIIRAGGTVNFVVAGFHQILVYDDGTA